MLDAFLSYLGPFGAALAGVAGVETALNGAPLWGASGSGCGALFALTEVTNARITLVLAQTTKCTSQTKRTQMDSSSRKELAQEMASRWKVQGQKHMFAHHCLLNSRLYTNRFHKDCC